MRQALGDRLHLRRDRPAPCRARRANRRWPNADLSPTAAGDRCKGTAPAWLADSRTLSPKLSTACTRERATAPQIGGEGEQGRCHDATLHARVARFSPTPLNSHSRCKARNPRRAAQQEPALRKETHEPTATAKLYENFISHRSTGPINRPDPARTSAATWIAHTSVGHRSQASCQQAPVSNPSIGQTQQIKRGINNYSRMS